MFLVQRNKKQSFSQLISLALTSSLFILKKVEIKFELQVQVIHSLEKLLRLKTQQIKKYGQKLSSKSGYYCQYQMVKSFLWM